MYTSFNCIDFADRKRKNKHAAYKSESHTVRKTQDSLV